jgi:hypothetical protein
MSSGIAHAPPWTTNTGFVANFTPLRKRRRLVSLAPGSRATVHVDQTSQSVSLISRPTNQNPVHRREHECEEAPGLSPPSPSLNAKPISINRTEYFRGFFDHKRVAILYLISTTAMFFVGGFLLS